MDAESVPNVRTLCVRLLGVPPRLADMSQEARLEAYDGRPRILVRAGTSPARARWLACHELAHWWLLQSGQEDTRDAETQASILGAAIVAPRDVVVRAYKLHGTNTIWIARALCTTQSLALLRLGEVGLLPSGLVGSGKMILRGQAERWTPVDITDEPDRVGLIAI